MPNNNSTTEPKPKVKRTPKDNKILQQKKVLLAALEKSLGVVTTACKSVGLDRGTFYQYYHKDASFKAAVDDIENVALDFAESQLHKQIQRGEVSSTIFYLKTKGKHRGYVEKQQTEYNGNVLLNHGVDDDTIEKVNAIYDRLRKTLK